MAQNQDIIQSLLSAYYNNVKDLYPIKKIILYGSYAKGVATPDSDIDVAVVIDWPKKNQWDDIGMELWKQARKVDSRIEPRCIFWDTWQNHEPASIVGEIARTGLEVI